MVIYTADEKGGAFGLADRLRGAVSVYKICKELNLDFKINFTSPFKLNNYLIPNIYDWEISHNEICFNKKYSKPCRINTYSALHHRYSFKDCEFWMRKFFKENCRQIHIYSNIDISGKEFPVLFNELFKMHPNVAEQVNRHINYLGKNYISAAFRFLQLLGDFKEPCGGAPPLADGEKNKLINRCIKHLKEIREENESCAFFITSDSKSFLAKAAELPFVHVIDGEIIHIDSRSEVSGEAVLKVFLDFFVLFYSKKVYLVIDGGMYNSAFSRSAALANNVQFVVKNYNEAENQNPLSNSPK
ncbi:MAG: hypothetical protein LBC53_00170 [Spirochaetaceae bacterium]|jgi:hypothetical protein|nr:hypothetical protein [Spirochaetaceae bacterium]